MAFRNAANTSIAAANSHIYTAASNAIIFSMYVTNTGGADTTANVCWYDNSADKFFTVAFKLNIAQNNAWYTDKPLALMPSDVLYVRAANCDISCGILEMT